MGPAQALAAALLAALAAAASWTTPGGGYYLFFIGLSAAAIVVAVAVARPRRGSVELARIVAFVWDGMAIWAALLLAGFAGQAASPPPGPLELFLGVPVTAFHVVAAYGGAALVSLAAFGTPRTSRLVIALKDR